jgi:hypothetical protein
MKGERRAGGARRELGLPRGGADAGGGTTGGAGGGGAGSGGGSPDCPVEWLVGIHELVATSLPESAILPGGDLVLGGVASPVEHFYDLTGYYSQPLVVRLTPSGQEVWRVTLPATNDAYVNSMVVGADGTIYLAGSFSGELTAGATTLTSSGVDALVVALSVNGEVLWAKQFGNGAAQRAWHLAMDGTGDLIIGGPFMGTIDFGGGLLSATNGRGHLLGPPGRERRTHRVARDR